MTFALHGCIYMNNVSVIYYIDSRVSMTGVCNVTSKENNNKYGVSLYNTGNSVVLCHIIEALDSIHISKHMILVNIHFSKC